MIENPVLTAIVMVLIIIFLVLACAFVYLTTPNKFRIFDLPVIYCHRGYYDNEKIPENSLSAFRKCAEKELAVELDVRPTKDGEIVIFHDGNLNRMCGVDKKVSELTFAELSELRLLGTEEKIPLFTEAMEACAGVPIYCEIKTDSTAIEPEFLEKVYELMQTYEGQIVAVSFNPYVLQWFKINHPEVIRGQLSAGKDHLGVKGFSAFALSNLLTNYAARPDFIAYRFDDKSLGFLLCRHYGTRLVGWTVHSVDDVEKAAYEGFSSFVGEKFDMTEV